MNQAVKEEITSVLDLPLERQKEIAAITGFGEDIEAWRADVKKSHDEMQDHVNNLETVSYDDLSPREKEVQDHWQRKVDSGNPIR